MAIADAQQVGPHLWPVFRGNLRTFRTSYSQDGFDDGLRQSDIETLVRIDASVVSDYERGRREPGSVFDVLKLCLLYDTNLAHLFGLTPVHASYKELLDGAVRFKTPEANEIAAVVDELPVELRASLATAFRTLKEHNDSTENLLADALKALLVLVDQSGSAELRAATDELAAAFGSVLPGVSRRLDRRFGQDGVDQSA